MNKTKRKIFETSMKLFAEKGYDATSIEEITATVGVAKGTLYYHFSSKEEIFNFLVEKYPNLNITQSNRNIIFNPFTNKGLEIDILIQKKDKILCGVEYNGIYWHNKDNPERENLKSELCKEKGIKLFFIWEDTEKDDLLKLEKFLSYF